MAYADADALEYAKILHDYVPDKSQEATSACLSLRAGEILRIVARDASGWYDCDYRGERGWAPSNYLEIVPKGVKVVPTTHTALPSLDLPRVSEDDDQLLLERSPLSPVLDRFAGPSATAMMGPHATPASLELDVAEAIVQLRNVVLADKVDSFQTVTADLITTVRAVLSTADCLTRDSATLRSRPELVPERKRVLTALSALVNEARKATAPSASAGQRLEITERMLELAESASSHVSAFQRAAKSTTSTEDGRLSPTSMRGASVLDRGRPPNLRVKRSIDEGKPTLPLATQVSPAMSAVSYFSDDVQSPTEATTPVSPLHFATSPTSTAPTDPSPLSPAAPSPTPSKTEFLPNELLQIVTRSHDALVSTMAALIGHVHTFSRTSHASSFAQLIDLTREAVERVRTVLMLIEAVASHPSIKCRYKEEFDALTPSRDELYAATTALVITARDATDADANGGPAQAADDEDRRRLLQCATQILRLSGDCASSVKFVLARQSSNDGTIFYSGPAVQHSDGSEDVSSARSESPIALVSPQIATISQLSSTAMSRAQSAPMPRMPQASSQAMSRNPSAQTTASDASSATYATRASTARTTPCSSLGNHDSVAQSMLPPLPPAAPPKEPSTSTLPRAALSRRQSADAVPSTAKNILDRDYKPEEIAFNAEGQVIGGTLSSLVERLTLHDTTIDPVFSKTFFLTFRLFATPTQVFDALCARFSIAPPADSDEAFAIWQTRKARPVQLRVYNTFKTWLEQHWQEDSDAVILPPLLDFAETKVTQALPSAANRLSGLVRQLLHKTAPPTVRQRALSRVVSREALRPALVIPDQPMPGAAVSVAPVTISKQVLAALRSSTGVNILDVDPLELARQLTLLEAEVYSRISPDELLSQATSSNKTDAVNVRAMSAQSTKLTGWVAETILAEHNDVKRRTALLKYFIKVSERCLAINNFNGLTAILCALNSSTIARLKKTWDGLSAKYKAQLEVLRKVTDHSRNYAEYRSRLRTALPPCLPFVGIFLTDITFSMEGNAATRRSPLKPELELINFDRYTKIARIVADLQRFQQSTYHFAPCSELQTYLERHLNNLKFADDVQSLYRQSLKVEPRPQASNGNAPPPTPRLTTEFLNWR